MNSRFSSIQKTRRTARQPHRASAFTLIELLLVMVILVVLAAVVVPRFASRSEQARLTAAKNDVATIETAIDAFEVDNGRYPSSEEGVGALVTAPNGLTNWHGPYIKKNTTPVDPWGHEYVYHSPGTHNTAGYDLFSMGPDGREGNDDVTNW